MYAPTTSRCQIQLRIYALSRPLMTTLLLIWFTSPNKVPAGGLAKDIVGFSRMQKSRPKAGFPKLLVEM